MLNNNLIQTGRFYIEYHTLIYQKMIILLPRHSLLFSSKYPSKQSQVVNYELNIRCNSNEHDVQMRKFIIQV